MSDRRWTLNPADFALLWDECPRCFYLTVACGFPRPAPAPPSLLPRIEAQIKDGCVGRRTDAVAPDMPAGVFDNAPGAVQSAPIDVHVPDAVYRCVMRDGVDGVVRLDAGGYALAELATSARLAGPRPPDGRRLHAAAYALEHPGPGAPALGPVTRLGLLVFEPEKFAGDAGGAATLSGGLSWLEIPRDDGDFFGFLAQVLAVLERPQPPGGAPLCPWCVYRDASRRTGL
jgi:hypothetical protein